MHDFDSQITNLKAEFQRVADRAPWVRARFTLKEGKFSMFILGSPVGDAAIVGGVRKDSDPATAKRRAGSTTIKFVSVP